MRLPFLRPFLLAALASLSGCSLLYDPCGDLEERLCADLGGECGTFRSEARIHESVIPQRRRQAERSQCEMFAADVNYASYTLPYVRYQVEQRKNPALRMPTLPNPQPAGLSAATASYAWYALPFFLIPGMFVYSWYARRKLMGATTPPLDAQAAYVPPPAAGAPPALGAPAGAWDHVDSRAAAEELARAGTLVPAELSPGGLPVPENIVYLPPAAAARMTDIARQIEHLRQSGHSGQAIAEAQYRGRSVVPSAIVVRFGEIAETVQVW